MSTISASTTSTTAYKVTADTTGTLVFQTGATPTTAMTLGTDQSVTFAGTPTYSGGTANGVAYLNGSKVLTTGSALVFNGTSLGMGVTPSVQYSGIKSFQIGSTTNLFDNGASTKFYHNAYTAASGDETYLTNGYAQGYLMASNGQHQWYTAASGTGGATFSFTQPMTLDASGNLGIGTTSPSTYGKFVTYSSGGYFSVDTNGQVISAQLLDVATAGGRFTGYSSRGALGAIHIEQATTSADGGYMTFRTCASGSTSTTERARIDSSGNLLVGDTTTIGTGGKFQVKSSTDTSIFKCTSSTTYAAIVSNVENTAARLMAFQYGSGGSPTNVGTITTNGTGVTYGTSSDYRLKENIAPMTRALDKVAQLKPVTYKWKANGSDGQGFIAHELKEVVPDAVQGEKDAVDEDGNLVYQGIDTSYLVATLTAAIQEQQAIITQLQADVAALKGA